MSANVAVLTAEADSLTWNTVTSSNVRSVAFSPQGRLYVRFKGGGKDSLYVYHVPDDVEGVFRGLVAAPSKGQYVYYVLRKNYSYDRLG